MNGRIQQVEKTYTVQVPKTVFEEVAYTVLVPVVHQFKTPAAESSGKPRVELLQSFRNGLEGQVDPEAGRIPHSLQYTSDGLRLLVGNDRGVSSIHPFYFFELLEHRGEGSRDAASAMLSNKFTSPRDRGSNG